MCLRALLFDLWPLENSVVGSYEGNLEKRVINNVCRLVAVRRIVNPHPSLHLQNCTAKSNSLNLIVVGSQKQICNNKKQSTKEG